MKTDSQGHFANSEVAPEQAADCRLGLIGCAIQSSKSPLLHQTEAAAHGLRCTYELIDLDCLKVGVERLPELIAEAEQRGFTGLNITYPCKQAVIPLLHEMHSDADAIGAVNTVRFRGGRRVGYNTDAWGFAESFRRHMQGASIGSVALIGAGGAGAATAFALLELGTLDLRVLDADHGKADALASSLAARFHHRRVRASHTLEDALARADGLINATPVGMVRHPGSVVPAAAMHPDLWVADLVYFPLETQLLREARAAGCRTLPGGGMAVYQAAKAFEIFTGRAADAARMRRQLDRIVEG